MELIWEQKNDRWVAEPWNFCCRRTHVDSLLLSDKLRPLFFATFVSVTCWVRTEWVLTREGALICKVPTKASPALQGHLGVEYTLLCLFKSLMCACGTGRNSLVLGEELIILRCLERNKQAKKKRDAEHNSNECSVTDQSTQAPKQILHAIMEVFLSHGPLSYKLQLSLSCSKQGMEWLLKFLNYVGFIRPTST